MVVRAYLLKFNMSTTRLQAKQKIKFNHEHYLHERENPEFLDRKNLVQRIRRQKLKSEKIENSKQLELLTRKVANMENQAHIFESVIREQKGELDHQKKMIADLSLERFAAFEVARHMVNKWNRRVELNINAVVENEKALYDMTGLSRYVFNEISNRIQQIKDVMPNDLKKKYCAPTKLDQHHKLYITLYWLRHYPKDRVLHWNFQIARSTVTRYIRRTLALIYLAVRDTIVWPTKQEIENELYHWNQFLPEQWKDMIFVIDGTELKIHRPSIAEVQRKCFSVKHKQAMTNVLVITKLNEEAVFVSRAIPTPSDQRIWNLLQLRKKFLLQHFGVIADGGFTPNTAKSFPKIKAVKPIKKPKNEELSTTEKEFNRTVAQLRVVVENRFSRAKSWMILSGTYRHYSLVKSNSIPVDLVIQTVFNLSEISIRQTPLRSPYWVPPSRREDLMLDLLPNELPRSVF